MFTSEHAIWQFAYAGDELDDWLGRAEHLVDLWASQNEESVEFENTFDIILASFLLKDDLLPPSARAAFAKLMLTVISESDNQKTLNKCLRIAPQKVGRKKDIHEKSRRILGVKELLKNGKTATEAYRIIGDESCRSPDTIRREYERALKRSRSNNLPGIIQSISPVT